MESSTTWQGDSFAAFEALPPITTVTLQSSTQLNTYLCPDLLRYDQLGAADGWRGKVVRVFFRILKVVSGI